MKNNPQLHALACLTALAISAQAQIITVNTTDNTDFSAGKTNFVTALNLLSNGVTINFNLPGTGAHYFLTPVGGYPLVTNLTNITINGYSQPGSASNTDTILSSNNAHITVFFTSTNGECRDLTGLSGFSQEGAVLPILGWTNVDISGLGFLGFNPGGIANNSDEMYAIAMGGNTANQNVHIHGCRFGLDADNVTVDQFQKNIVSYGAKIMGYCYIGVAPGSPNPRAEFNIFIGGYICTDLEGATGGAANCEYHISGNFYDVYPDGLHDFNIDGATHNGVDHIVEAIFEFGSPGTNSVFGTDGDGVNDAEERNVVGGVTAANDGNVWECYGNGPNHFRFSGNYCGVGVDGKTRFTNGGPNMLWLNISGRNNSSMLVGSDFDGVSDALEANLFYWNNPFSALYGTPPTVSPTASGSWAWLIGPNRSPNTFTGYIGVRGNQMVNNLLVPYMYADNMGDLLPGFINYMSPFINTTAAMTASDLLPTLFNTNIFPNLQGTFPPGIGSFTNIIVDVYQLDQEAWNNGNALHLSELTDGATYTNGFPTGSKYLGSYAVSNTGAFNINLPPSTDLGSGPVTVAINYSEDPAGTHNGRVHTGNFSNPAYPVPGGAGSVGLTQIVPDVPLWFNGSNFQPEIGPITNLGAQSLGAYLGTWDPYIGVLGESTFLIQDTTFASDGLNANMRFMVALQPAAGGAPKLVDVFQDDNGHPFTNQINESRQSGDPGRVGGDKRYGAVNYMAGGEVSLGGTSPADISPSFDSDGRFNPDPLYTANAGERYACGQIYALNPLTLSISALTKALDISNGRLTNTAPPASWPNPPELVRWGGDIVALDNGNMLFVPEDRSGLRNPVGRCPSATIVAPNGAIVKDTFEIGGWTTNGNQNEMNGTNIDNEIWANVAAFKGGFAVRIGKAGMIYFYDDAGNFQGQLNITNSTGLPFSNGDRGDSERITSDIRSPYLYYVDRIPNPGGGDSQAPVLLCAFDTRTRSFINSVTVSDSDTNVEVVDRMTVAVDASNRLCVVYAMIPNVKIFGGSVSNPSSKQIVARVLQFDGANFTFLTHSFFPFVNHDSTGLLTQGAPALSMGTPEVAMTTREICIAAKGTLNSTNQPANGVDVTGANVTVYTVLSHPVPLPPPVPVLTATRAGANLNLTWDPGAGLFTVQASPAVAGSAAVWTNATAGNVAPPVSLPVSAGDLYIRLVRNF